MLTLTVPVSFANERGFRAGTENVLFASRFRINFEQLQRAYRKEGNYLQFLLGMELPTGSMDQPFGKAPTNALAGVITSIEKGQWATMAFALSRFEGRNGEGLRKGHELLSGAGVALTPLETSRSMVSAQLGASYEIGTRDDQRGGSHPNNAFHRIMLSPALVVGLGPSLQLLGYGSLPLYQQAALDSRIRFRFGAGAVQFF